MSAPSEKRTPRLFRLLTVVLGFVLACEALAAGVGKTGRWYTYNDQPAYLVGFDLQEFASDPAINYAAALQTFRDNKINKVRIWIDTWFLGANGLSPWARVGGQHDLNNWDPAYWSRVRDFVAAAKARDIVVEVAIFSPYPNATNYWWDRADFQNAWNTAFNINGFFNSNGSGHFYPEFYSLTYQENGVSLRTHQQRMVDKAVAELNGFDNVYFEVANEFAVGGSGSPPGAIDQAYTDQFGQTFFIRDWQLEWARRLDSTSPRLVAVHSDTDTYAGGSQYWRDQNYIDVLNYRLTAAFNELGTEPKKISDSLHSTQPFGKILSMNETAGPCLDEPCDYRNDLNLHTRYAWGMFVSGGHVAFLEFRGRNVGDATWLAGAARLRVLREIAETVRFWEMSPVDASNNEYDGLITQGPTGANQQVLANPGSQYVAYFWGSPTSTNVVINLPAGNYNYTWHDVRDKAVLANGSVTSSGGNTTIASPSASSWDGNAGVALVIQNAASNQTPFPGPNPHPIPGTIEAENFDNGGQDIAYSDVDAFNNTNDNYRTSAVEVITNSTAEGGFALGWTRAGEWVEYTVNVATTGNYTVEARVASEGVGGTFRIEFDGADKTGLYSIPNTGDWQAWTTLTKTGIALTAGTQVMRIFEVANGPSGSIGNINWARFTLESPQQTPFPGPNPHPIPGTIEAENFDNGGEAIAFHDVDTVNNAGNLYRTSAVEVIQNSTAEGGFSLGWTRASEWVEYTVTVASTGTYTVDARVASDGDGGTFHIEFNDVDRTGTFSIPNTGGWQNWTVLTKTGIPLTAGTHVMRIFEDANGPSGSIGNINWVRFTLESGSSGSLSASVAPAPATVNLTPEGTVDWVHWGLNGLGSIDRKSGVSPSISNYTPIGTGPQGSYGDAVTAYSWNDGTPTTVVNGSTTGLFADGVGNGYQITVPADQTPRTLKLYLGAWVATGRLEASLSDGSAPAYTDTSLTGASTDGGTNVVYTIAYQAASANQQMTIQWTLTAGSSGGNVTLQAATLRSN